jgi:hypothetical protein
LKYELKYSNSSYLSEVEPGILKGEKYEPCWKCGFPTRFIDMDFQAYLCSTECLELVMDEYATAASAPESELPPLEEPTSPE